MRPRLLVALAATALLPAGAMSVSGQELSEICPNAAEGTGAIWGLVSDPDVGMGLPGAKVVARWTEDGDAKSAEVATEGDGQYTLCYVPLGVDLTVRPMLATTDGAETALLLDEVFTRQDLVFSMTGAGSGSVAAEDDRLWVCIAGGQSQINIQNSRLLRCEDHWQPLERCPKEELGHVSANRAGRGSGAMREMLERFIQDARRLGANAVINVDGSMGAIRGEAVRIEVDPSSC